MYFNFHNDLDALDDLLGIDVLLRQYGIANTPSIGYITDYHVTDDPDFPRDEITLETHRFPDLTFTAETHLTGEERTFTGTPDFPILGQTFDVHVLETKITTGEWNEIARADHKHTLPINKYEDQTTRIRTEQYTYADETTKPWDLTYDHTGITTIPEGRRTLTETLQNLSEGDSFTVGIDAGKNSFSATAHSISHELPDTSDESDPPIPENYTITATDKNGATLTLEHTTDYTQYSFADKHTTSSGGHLQLTRTSPTPPQNRSETDIGDFSGTVTSMDVPGPNEFKHLPWLASIRSAFDLPDSHTDGNNRYTLGTVYLPKRPAVGERDDNTLYQVTINQPFKTFYRDTRNPTTDDFDPVYPPEP